LGRLIGREGIADVDQCRGFAFLRDLRQQRNHQAGAPGSIGSVNLGQAATRQAASYKLVYFDYARRNSLCDHPWLVLERFRHTLGERSFNLSAQRGSKRHGPNPNQEFLSPFIPSIVQYDYWA